MILFATGCMDRRIITIFPTAVFRSGTHFVGTEQCHDRRDNLHNNINLKVCNDVIAVKSSLPITKKGYHTVITPITLTKIQNKKAFVKSLSPFYSQTFANIWKDSENWLNKEKSIAT